jgi:hypothetical protein
MQVARQYDKRKMRESGEEREHGLDSVETCTRTSLEKFGFPGPVSIRLGVYQLQRLCELVLRQITLSCNELMRRVRS